MRIQLPHNNTTLDVFHDELIGSVFGQSGNIRGIILPYAREAWLRVRGKRQRARRQAMAAADDPPCSGASGEGNGARDLHLKRE